jgi:hypothetical protein
LEEYGKGFYSKKIKFNYHPSTPNQEIEIAEGIYSYTIKGRMNCNKGGRCDFNSSGKINITNRSILELVWEAEKTLNSSNSIIYSNCKAWFTNSGSY